MSGSEVAQAVGLVPYITLSLFLFGVGLTGLLLSRHLVRLLMCLELMLNAVNLNLVALNHHLTPDTLGGQVFAMFILTVSAAEAAVGLAIVIVLFRMRSTVDVEAFEQLRG
jgi:NADH:ubiquinone oxidoreductase subunit K